MAFSSRIAFVHLISERVVGNGDRDASKAAIQETGVLPTHGLSKTRGKESSQFHFTPEGHPSGAGNHENDKSNSGIPCRFRRC